MNVVITGASRGIGKSIAEGFAARGAHLFLCARNMSKTIQWQQELMEKHSIKISSFDADLSKSAAVQLFAQHILSATDQIDILINNTGIYEPGSTYNEAEGQLEKMLDVNLFSAYHLTRALIGVMIKKKSGHIFNICSIASLTAYPNGGSYSISKWALAGFSKNLREEMKPHHIKVTSVYPGATLTSSWDGMDVDPQRILETADITKMILSCHDLSVQACVEDIVIRPQLGDV